MEHKYENIRENTALLRQTGKSQENMVLAVKKNKNKKEQAVSDMTNYHLPEKTHESLGLQGDPTSPS